MLNRTDNTAGIPRSGFTLIELMIAMTIMLAAATMVLLTFHGVTRAWRNGTKLVEELDHGDFVMDQLVLALRSAYFPDTGGKVIGYGFLLEDGGSGPSARDSISWVKMGAALTETNSPTTAGPHRIEFMISETGDGRPAAAVRYWRPYALPEDFDREDIEPVPLSTRVTGFDCRVATNMTTDEFKWEWEDTWEDDATNRLPLAIELTVYLEPLEEGGNAVEISRVVEIPTAHLSWKDNPAMLANPRSKVTVQTPTGPANPPAVDARPPSGSVSPPSGSARPPSGSTRPRGSPVKQPTAPPTPWRSTP